MVPAPPQLPTQFPCWCRAIYSWGGESKRDLGFIEGDLIECLNAGDGSWWVGRLYRDRRTVGSFPSNFVSVLPEGFRPTAKSMSPMPESHTPSPQNMPTKSKTFRKPFEAYAKAPHYTSAKQPETFRDPPPKAHPKETPDNSFSKSVHEGIDRVSSPAPRHGYGSRAPSPAPSMMREPSRAPSDRGESPPPPAPPPHRHVGRGLHDAQHDHHDMSRHGSTASYNQYRHGSGNSYQPPHDLSRQGSFQTYGDRANEYRPYTPRAVSPRPPSPGPRRLTPSPLREAMNGVMEQLGELEGLGQPRRAHTPEPPYDPWAPEAFDMASPRSKRTMPEHTRPKTAMGISHHDEGYETWSGDSSQGASRHQGLDDRTNEPQLNTYVERMEKHFQGMHHRSESVSAEHVGDMGPPPRPPPKNRSYDRPKTSSGESAMPDRRLTTRKSAFEVGPGVSRTYTTKTNVTDASCGNQSNTSSSTQSSSRTLWSGASAGGFSSTSAGSYARTHPRAQSAIGLRDAGIERPETPFTGVTYHSSHASDAGIAARPASQMEMHEDLTAGLGGLVQPRAPKRNIFKKIFESAKTGVASNRGSIATGSGSGSGLGSVRSSPFARSLPRGTSPIPSPVPVVMSPVGKGASREMGLGKGIDWVQVRRDVNRSNSLSKTERNERRDRCQMMDHPALNPVDELFEGIEGDEGGDGLPVAHPLNYQSINYSQVDKNSRFISEPPSMVTARSLAMTYICRPFRSDVQRLRAIFTWVSEKVCWEEDFDGEIDTRRVIQSKRACAEEYAVLVQEMCAAVGLHCEIVRGYLKSPGDVPDLNMVPRSNHWWNAVVIDNEWRIMDCCLASPSNPRRGQYSSAGATVADFWWFLTFPTEACWTHVPEHHDQQHIVPPVAHEILLNLPCTCPNFFRNGIELFDYNTSATRIEDLEMVHIKFNVPADIEVAAEVEARAYARDADGDFFESGEIVTKRALVQAEWFNGVKRYTVKALLPGDEGQGMLKVYAGQRGLMHSIKDIPHPLAFALPILHTGENPPYEFVTRHPTPHAQRHDIYVVQPQCQRLALNNTFVFAIRQHPSSLSSGSESALTPATNPGTTSPIPFLRPGSAMSMTASSVGGSNPSSSTGIISGKKPAKLAIQTPGGKILRLMRKEERRGMGLGGKMLGNDDELSDGGTWETIIKCSERGTWRGLVLADRTARWCVFAEWTCVG
ncbi:hypothetical protein HIM_06409 [Hirsutella minnesotensis 3608]|uniref:SH3 domain-containing protein n=1 Tax=Hirsutella minnesotensis 3608 TaxID=1043627 RepID=A0A0F7ZU36_9HYPO|nr:hypothetical protein HIM_06409 [Hirsutella minnesotensis 3608]